MKSIALVLAITCVFTAAYAQDSTIIHLWPGAVPGAAGPKRPAEVTDNHSGGVTRLTNVVDPTLTVFRPAAGRANGAAMMVCPGGAYKILAIDLEGYEIAHWLTTLGFTAFVLEYRVPNDQQGALQDAQRGLRIIRSRAAEWGVNPAKIGVMGFSAGGSLSARISTEYDHSLYQPVDRADSASAKPDFTMLIYPAYLDQGPDRTLTPELHVDTSTPPIFIFQTADDPYGNSALTMARALRDAKASVELHFYPKGGHGYGMRRAPAGSEWPPLAAKWLAARIAAAQ